MLLEGRGAWQDWSYEVEVVSRRSNTTTLRREQHGTSLALSGLQRDTVYDVRVRASSTEGDGPWSTNFTAQTLPAGTFATANADDVLGCVPILIPVTRYTVDQQAVRLLSRLTYC